MSNFIHENWITLSLILFLYFLPTFISLFNKKSKSFGIFLVNFLLGWTILMWISLLIEAFQDPTISRYGDLDRSSSDDDESLKSSNIETFSNDFSKFMSPKSIQKWVRNLK